MRRCHRSKPCWRLPLLVCLAVGLLPPGTVWAARLILKDGRVLEGRLARLSSMSDKPLATSAEGAPDPMLIVLCDDGLRRYFIPQKQIQEATEAGVASSVETFRIDQPVARNGARVGSMGPIVRITPFDDYGRRTLEMSTGEKTVAIIQGITEITPTWTKLEGLDLKGNMGGKNLLLDMRIATSSIPPEILRQVLGRQIDPTKIEHRLKLVRLYLQAERFKDAEEELQGVVRDFPERQEQFAPALRELKQAYARMALNEIRARQRAGQHTLVWKLLGAFPTEGVAGETVQAARQMRDDYTAEFARGKEIVEKLDEHIALVQDSALRERIKPIRDEIHRQLNFHTLNRLAAYRQFWDDAALTPEDKLALAISGWLVGANDATRRLPVALSLVEVRSLVRQYLSEPIKLRRHQILASFASQEGSTPQLVARLLWHMTPPLEAPPPPEETPGSYELSVDGLPGEPPVTYYVQLPLEYDPYRLYPTVLSLNGAGTTPQQQVDWWAGARDDNGQRRGQAARHGYVVIAPAWSQEHQKNYRFSAAEHAAVLNTLRDACRRFAIDTDRVFLSGHSMGGDAAWDIGLAHPDLWAGVIPIVARSDKYIHHYTENAARLPLYLVGGQLDGGKAVNNALDLDRYMTDGFNVTVAEYQGRGHEHFSDEIQQLFDWMGRCERDFVPKEIGCRSMRTWDNYFWWLELDELPAKTIVHPDAWPPPRGTRAASTRATINATGGINVRTGAARVTLWLSPEVIDFGQRAHITVNGSRLKLEGPFIEPDLAILLEDARTRADRQHPFWAKVEMPAGRVNVAGR